ncbi:hypothetical protein E2C01_005781 [Portunus trituberculatus]|uniref:Uncharacterized protein n=1 Tax=Portunus trituberculatus TaxID=210409 RepID=A0A5B7CTK7_PORTR|nr:hypothetical protein [Portunus trituberculatus]
MLHIGTTEIKLVNHDQVTFSWSTMMLRRISIQQPAHSSVTSDSQLHKASIDAEECEYVPYPTSSIKPRESLQ